MTTLQQLKKDGIEHALEHGIDIPYKAHAQIIERLSDVQAENKAQRDDKGRPLDERYTGWLHQLGITPNFGESTHIPAHLVKTLSERIKNKEHHVAQVVDVVLEEAYAPLKEALVAEAAAKQQRAETQERGQREEPESKKDAEKLTIHAKQYGITLTASEVAKVFDALNPLEATRLQHHLGALEVDGVVTGRHGNRTSLPEKAITLSAHQYEVLEAACPTQMKKAATVIAALHADKQHSSGPKNVYQHAQNGQANGSYRSA